MKIYIAGKITGDPDYRAKFKSAQLYLEALGHSVLNPATSPAGLRPADYMRLDFAMIDAADAVMFLHDWQDSPGAYLERQYCEYTGKGILPFYLWEVEKHE